MEAYLYERGTIMDVPYCYQDKVVQPYKTPDSIKFLKDFDFNKEVQ